MKKMTLDKDEVQILSQVVKASIMDLRVQIRETDNYEFKQMLKKRRKVLSKIKDALEDKKSKK